MDQYRPGEAHRRYEEMAVAHVLGGLDETDGRVFRSHLLECGDCRARVGELRALAHDLADVERDERRVRAAKTVETKNRESEPQRVEEPPRPFRPRIMTVLGIAAILALSAWNFTLRGNAERFDRQFDRSVEAAAVLEFGDPGSVMHRASSVRGQAKVDRGRLVVLLDGLDDERAYGLYLLDTRGEPVFRAAVASTQGRLFSLVDLPEGAHRVLVTAPGGQPVALPSGPTIFEARLPRSRS